MTIHRRDIECLNCHAFGEWQSATPAYQPGFNNAYLTFNENTGRTIWCRNTSLDSPDDVCLTPCVNCLWYEHNCIWNGQQNYGTDYAPSECEYSISTCRCIKLTENRAANILIEMYEQAVPPVPFDAWVTDCVPDSLAATVIAIHEEDISDTETIIE